MKENSIKEESPIYPGNYVPSPEMKNELNRSKISEKGIFAAKPPVNISETTEYFIIHVAIPGVERENISIQIHGDHLSVMTVCKKHEEPQIHKSHIQEFDKPTCFERHILLPENADTIFIRAEYKQGVLYLYIPKSYNTANKTENHIVAY